MNVSPAMNQSRGAGVFPSYVVENPQRYGEGIFSHIIQSDNFFRQGQFEEALNELDYALSQDPYFAEAYIKRAIVKFKIGRITEASLDYQKARRINPYASELYGYNGPLRRLGVLATSYEQGEGKGMTPFSPDTMTTSILKELESIIHQKQNGDILGALAQINTMLDTSRQPDPVLFKIRGNILVLLDQHFDAISDYSAAIALDPAMKEAYFNRGIAKILTYNRADACYDIQESINKGYEKGKEVLRYFCNF
jgi:Flp pilus assembly protein TadD